MSARIFSSKQYGLTAHMPSRKPGVSTPVSGTWPVRVSDPSGGAVAIVCPGSHSLRSIDIPSSPWFGVGTEPAKFLPEKRIRRVSGLA